MNGSREGEELGEWRTKVEYLLEGQGQALSQLQGKMDHLLALFTSLASTSHDAGDKVSLQ